LSLTVEVRRAATLQQAWFAIRANASASRSGFTKREAAEFERALPQNIRALQERLRKGYAFKPSLGVLKMKKGGSGKRGLVVAPLADRIVQRAALDVLQRHDAPSIQSVLETPTSFGGIPGRGVADAIHMIERVRRDGGAVYLAGSDISGFFTKIDVASVVEFIAEATQDAGFTQLFNDALQVDLTNASELTPEELALFPRAGIGVAQGCPLSALAGNIFLRSFDALMNEGSTACLRYIDDFILLCQSESEAREALGKAKDLLKGMGLTTYDPVTHPNKAFLGPFSSKIEFLGHRMEPGKYPPTEGNVQSLLRGIELDIAGFHTHVQKIRSGRATNRRQSFVATVSSIDQRVMAWGGAFSASACSKTAEQVDHEIDRQIGKLIDMYSKAKKAGAPKRTLFGVHSVMDGLIAE
jgi:retron-type reverse transcriptase